MDEDAVFQALADATRRRLLDRLYDESGLTLSQLCEGENTSRQAVSKHLAILEEANLVAVRWKGREKLHFLNPVPISAIADRWMSKFEHEQARALRELKAALEKGR